MKFEKKPVQLASITDAIKIATLLPMDFTTKLNVVNLGSHHIWSVSTQGNRTGKIEELFSFLNRSMWPDPNTPVIMQPRTKGAEVSNEFSVLKRPIPYILRKSGEVPASAVFGIYISPAGGANAFWRKGLGFAFFLIMFLLVIRFKYPATVSGKKLP